MILLNPIVLSVFVLSILCLLKLPVLGALLIAALTAGLAGGSSLSETMVTFVGGMGGNANTALSYILLGSLAYTINKTGAADILARKISAIVRGNKFTLSIIIILVSVASGTIVPTHIAFIPILIPPLLILMNKMKMDRRMLAVCFGYGLKAPYITIPIAYGAIFQGIIRDSVNEAGLNVDMSLIWRSTWMAGIAMTIGLIFGLLYYSKNREYKMSEDLENSREDGREIVIEMKHWMTLVAGIIALVVQLMTGSLPLGALAALIFIVVTKTVKWSEIQEIFDGGIGLMGFIAFVMLIASGYATVIRSTGAIEQLVEVAFHLLGGSKIAGAFTMILLGLLITMGIGTSFGTVPVIAAIYVPLSQKLGFSPAAIVFMVAVAAALGDAGSPASDTTLGPTAGLNVDGQHDHIWDTCIPQFICFDIPLMIAGVLWPLFI
ncbi:Na+/H+ antiporter NhaC family protein [Fusobacterium necrophorum]|uniref:Sodium:proton antiporter n=2 Tax=Fusobacterium necrophorum TaxID=859 RepID=A0AB73BW49_9FUSO|nr:Na+/H+ antiporter NhaC family protein [Fusobacterium necrophorum]KDE63030.1 sodium:proton antiporter [Fusobacterium necrophorum BL]KDE65219.1 sodium:proton antiporter [Fusobacterium necrophorum BFTR-1]KDE67537.1 sodium:proton antiporter [Fusobacterium necrophorum DJ-1]KDE70359.1 sodium:proton antiporter [Fusobacterium necrophorum DAB]KDE73481.1 sodium:proton antiporter [Fusobacterium necrophorum DJ-2]